VHQQSPADWPGDAQLPLPAQDFSASLHRGQGRQTAPELARADPFDPYLDQEALYKEFRLDEPWDSEHNRALIDRMPPTYHCPGGSSKRADQSKTTYLTPRGKATIFPGSEGIKIQKITDGTSNTIFVVDAGNDRAVTWTKPDDWDVDPKLDLKGIFGHHPGGTPSSFADGSVRFIKETVDPKTLEMLITRDGGEVISQDAF